MSEPAGLGVTEPNDQGRQYRHGTLSAYNSGKCGCGHCRRAFADYRAQRRAPNSADRLTAATSPVAAFAGLAIGLLVLQMTRQQADHQTAAPQTSADQRGGAARPDRLRAVASAGDVVSAGSAGAPPGTGAGRCAGQPHRKECDALHCQSVEHARDLAAAGDSADSQQALDRVLDYYQYAAALAESRLARQTRPGPGPCAPQGFDVPALEDGEQALAWVRADRASLLACLDLVARTGQHARVVAMTAAVAAVLRRDGPWNEAVTRHAIAVDAARSLGDLLAEANAFHDLGEVVRLTGDHPRGGNLLEQALGIYRDLGDRLGEANLLNDIGIMRRLTDDYQGAAVVLEQALSICCDLGELRGEANTLHNLGIMRYLTGDFPGAATVLSAAQAIFGCLGERLGEASTLHDLGVVRRLTGDYPGAATVITQALRIFRDLGDRLGEANILSNQGDVLRLTGDYAGAGAALEQALRIYRDLGSRLGEANALHNLGMVRQMTGEPERGQVPGAGPGDLP